MFLFVQTVSIWTEINDCSLIITEPFFIFKIQNQFVSDCFLKCDSDDGVF